jgi:hypothetical protein
MQLLQAWLSCLRAWILATCHILRCKVAEMAVIFLIATAIGFEASWHPFPDVTAK